MFSDDNPGLFGWPESGDDETPSILYVCVHNAGRSQMAAGYTRALSEGRVRVASGGTTPADRVHPVVEQAMAEDGVDISDQRPRPLDADLVDAAHVIVTMGCDDDSPFLSGRRTLDWQLDDPAGRPIEQVRLIRDDVRDRVTWLLNELEVLPSA